LLSQIVGFAVGRISRVCLARVVALRRLLIANQTNDAKRCLAVFEIFNTHAYESSSPLPGAAPEETILRLPEEGKRAEEPTTRKNPIAAPRRPSSSELKLPSTTKLSLAVIAGPEAGKIYPIEKPRVVIGRQDADINVDDPEISRQHAALEVSGEKSRWSISDRPTAPSWPRSRSDVADRNQGDFDRWIDLDVDHHAEG
jgi:hypothetical protein